MQMKANWKALTAAVALPLAVGGLAALLTMDGMKDYAGLNQPPLAPPGWLFPVAWTVLYVLMGYASYLVFLSPSEKRGPALTLYAVQLGVNFVWPLLFFGLEWYLTSFFWLVLLWVLIYLTIRQFSQVSQRAANLLLPYILWVTFAGYLNLSVFLLN